MYADSEASVLAALVQVREDIWEPNVLELRVGAEPPYLFDSAFSGADADAGGALLIAVPPGNYTIRTGTFQPDDRTSLILRRLDRQPVSP